MGWVLGLGTTFVTQYRSPEDASLQNTFFETRASVAANAKWFVNADRILLRKAVKMSWVVSSGSSAEGQKCAYNPWG